MWRNLMLTIASIVVGLILIEAAGRLFITLPSPYVNAPGLVVKDARGFWTLRPGYVDHMSNKVDFRDRVVHVDERGGRHVSCRDAAIGSRKIVLLGDSQTYGHGLADDDSWASRLQCRMVSKNVPGRVINLGIPGINIDSYAMRLIQVLPALAPDDRVVVAITWNDLHSAQSNDYIASLHRRLKEIPAGGDAGAMNAQPVKPFSPLQRATWRYNLYRRTGFMVPSFDGPKSFVESMLFSSVMFATVYPRFKEAFYRLRPNDAFFRKISDGTFENNFRLLSYMQEAVARSGAKMDVVLLPNRIFFDRTYYDAYSQGGTVFPDHDFPGYLARKFCPDLGLACTSMFPFLKTDERDAHTYVFDGHYNPAGAKRVAQGLVETVFSTDFEEAPAQVSRGAVPPSGSPSLPSAATVR